jgi:outer membrane protein assembly factor BamB
VPAGAWPDPNGDIGNTRVGPDSVISAANVSGLREAWAFKLSGPAAAGVSGIGSLTAPPVVRDGVVYLQDEDANVYALSLATGKLKWEYPVNVPEKSGPGPDGVAVADGTVYGDSSTTVFALNAATGATRWVDGSLLTPSQGAFEIQPQVADGRVYLASAYGSGPGGGVLMALDASTGHRLWTFNTVIGQGAGVRALGLGSGGAWEPPLVGSDGSVTFGTGNPYQSIGQAIAHPSRQLYTDSAVNLDAATGKLRWYYQAVPDDFQDHDLQGSPVSAVIGGKPAIIASGKVGYVYALGARTGALLWKTPVGAHNGHDNDSRLALSHQVTVTYPYTVEPGALGGILSDVAVAGGSVYVATIDLPITYTSKDSVTGNKPGRRPARWRRSAWPPAGSNGIPRSPRCRSARPRSPATWSSPRSTTASWSPSTGARAPSSTGTSCPHRRTRRSRSSATRYWSRRAAPRRRPRAVAATRNWWLIQCTELGRCTARPTALGGFGST